MIEEAGTIYYDDSIESVVKYRRDPRPIGLMQFGSDSSGWTPLYNSITGLRLRVTDGMIEVRGMGPFRRLGKWFGFELSLAPDETTMMTIPLSRVVIGHWRFRGPRLTTSLFNVRPMTTPTTPSPCGHRTATLIAFGTPYRWPE